jgi:dsDNA-specific endonuclease/ATPase MutS2
MRIPFKIGDKVAVLDDTIKGIVSDIDDKNITIKTEDGFPMKYNASELVLITRDQADYSKYIDIKHDALIEKESSSVKKRSKKSLKSGTAPPLEVDLHIHQLTKSSRGMTNHDMLTLQVDTAKRQLEFAIRKRIQRVVFIHGVGEGVLRNELEYLFGRYNVELRQASFQKYGMGATEIYIYQNN